MVETLAQLGITAIDLNPTLATKLDNGNLVYGTDTFTAGSHTGAVAQIGLTYDQNTLYPTTNA